MEVILLRGFQTIIGLMLKRPREDTIYLFDLGSEKTVDVHTFFCLEPLDIYILDEDLRIVEIYRGVRPFRIILPKRKFRYFAETKHGLLKDKNIGDRIVDA